MAHPQSATEYVIRKQYFHTILTMSHKYYCKAAPDQATTFLLKRNVVHPYMPDSRVHNHIYRSNSLLLPHTAVIQVRPFLLQYLPHDFQDTPYECPWFHKIHKAQLSLTNIPARPSFFLLWHPPYFLLPIYPTSLWMSLYH